MQVKEPLKINDPVIDPSTIASRKEPLFALMCTPDFFKIVDVKNVHMQGNAGTEDRQKAIQQWQSIYSIYQQEAAAGNIDGAKTIEGSPDCEDMVFCANQSFPWINKDEKKMVIMSRMKHPSRQNEVPFFEAYYKKLDYTIVPPPGDGLLEGMGDLIPVPGKRLIFGGYGHRTDLATLEILSEILDCKIVPLELINDAFYHLDTCFIPLDLNTVLIVKEAFTKNGYDLIKSYFKEVIEIPLEEATKGFALNAHIVHGHQDPFAIIQQGNPFTTKALRDKGFKVYEVDTSEFMKSGGSVFCMKMMFY
jgi:N-dimethylarginine dimethylaminohydrolase